MKQEKNYKNNCPIYSFKLAKYLFDNNFHCVDIDFNKDINKIGNLQTAIVYFFEDTPKLKNFIQKYNIKNTL